MLGRPAIRVVANAGGTTAELEQRLRSEALFATAKVPTRATADAALLQGLGFQVVDALLSFEAPVARLASSVSPPACRLARADDTAEVVRIAGASFQYSRFHLDPQFPAGLANRIKREWVGNFFKGRRGDLMIVAQTQGRIGGFLLALNAGSKWIIDLIAVDPTMSRRGLGRQMIEYLARWMSEQASGHTIAAGTQAANLGAIGLYESLGFRLVSSSFVLHHHGIHSRYEGAST